MKSLIAVFASLVVSSFTQAAEVSITMDDFNVHEDTRLPADKRNEAILSALKKHKVKAALFVTCKHLKSPRDEKLLAEWSRQGHLIGNHTVNHKRFDAKVSVTDEIAEIQQCEEQLKNQKNFEKIFRFPMLAEGDTAEKRDAVREWMKKNSYRNGHVTIDASDWYVDRRLRDKLGADPNFDLSKFRDFYLQHMWDRAQYYNDLSKKVLGHEVKHTLLVHYNLVNALFLDDLIAMFKKRGWKVIDAKIAFKDPVFTKLPDSMPSGQSLIWALAKESGKHEAELRYPGENDTYEKEKMDALGL
ncbi:polysaccharide deacetylase family protein [Bdellovibrio bacteriovorus]|uniref:Polysaccharide deacetylase-related protein n=1 Tax=Bdellovibrio bacteriovorus str. Tiberius TaxID=1069642 RepID=K7ZDR9_BDEBC|nr:polysaccharide deacetylase family protein [Bdellovibrio bacteriovorus]AFX99781.1 polysaccharide deacetylase-related protein [Bdellovibrio bacteriovorus str. Tiberius]